MQDVKKLSTLAGFVYLGGWTKLSSELCAHQKHKSGPKTDRSFSKI